jgi:hypothetical protein
MKSASMGILTAATGALALCAASTVYAASLEPPGWTSGIALGGPLPQGVYFIDTASTGGWRGVSDHESSLGVNIPLIAWSTPWTLAGGRVEVLGTAPEISGGIPQLPGSPSWAGRDYTAFYNPAAFAGVAWDLGRGWGFSFFIGGWAPADNDLAKFGFDTWTLSEKANLSYTANGWKLAANVSFGQPGNSKVSTVLGSGQILPNYINYDLTATKTIGKWELGLVGFGSADTGKAPWNGLASTAFNGTPYGKQSQFALGGLAGYNFPAASVQVYATRDVSSSNYYNLDDGSKSYETRVWSRLIVPLGNPGGPAPLK